MTRFALCATLVAALAQPVLADEKADVQAGEDLAKRWCVACHVVGPDVAGGDAGPSFESVARRPGVNQQNIKVWLADPHPPMDNLSLTAEDTRVLTQYIFSLGGN